MGRRVDAISDRFWAKVDIRWPFECWEWQGKRLNGAYGQFHNPGGTTLAHRISYELAVGPISDGQLVRHKCDNPPCVNPYHLETGTHSDNIQDAWDRGRRKNRTRREREAA